MSYPVASAAALSECFVLRKKYFPSPWDLSG